MSSDYFESYEPAFLPDGQAISPGSAFQTAQEDARHEWGHNGMTGTVAEKPGFRMVDTTPELETEVGRNKFACENGASDPAFCVLEGGRTFVFFGWARS